MALTPSAETLREDGHRHALHGIEWYDISYHIISNEGLSDGDHSQ